MAAVLSLCLAVVASPRLLLAQQNAEDAAANAAAAGGCLACGGFFFIFFLAIIALNIALLVWVYRDANNRGMDNAVIWLIVVLLIGPLGAVIYLLSRTKGNLAVCSSCQGKRLEVSAKCPHCGNA
jgi:uncharacterized membrane protein YhaH (DUF805 family)